MKDKWKKLYSKNTFIILVALLLCAVSIVSYVYHIRIAHGFVGFGSFDLGLYMSAFTVAGEHGFQFSAYPGWIKQSYSPAVLTIFMLFSKGGIDAELFLTWSTGLLPLLIAGAMYFYVVMSTKNKILGMIGFSLVLISYPFSLSVYYLYRKQLLGLLLLTLLLITHTKKWYLLTGIVIFLAVALHRPTGVVVGLRWIITVVGECVTDKKLSRSVIIAGLVGGLLGALSYLPNFKGIIMGVMEPLMSTTVNTQTQGGTFIERRFLLMLLLPIILLYPLGRYGGWKSKSIMLSRKSKKDLNIIKGGDSSLILLIIFVCRSVLGLFFYKRMGLYIHYFALIHLVHLLPLIRGTVRKKILIGVLILVQLGMYQLLAFRQPILLSDEVIRSELRHAHSLLPEDATILVLDSREAPIAVGYLGHDAIAPGYMNLNKRSDVQRKIFWNLNPIAQCQMIVDVYKEYHPVFLLVGPYYNNGRTDLPCAQELFLSKTFGVYSINFTY